MVVNKQTGKVAVALMLALLPVFVASESCKLLQLFPFEDRSRFSGRGALRGNFAAQPKHDRWMPSTIRSTGISYSAAAALAIRDFNARNGAIVPELAEGGSIMADCNVTLDSSASIIADSKLNNIVAGEAILNHTDSCAIIGPYDLNALSWTTSISASLDIPQIAYSEAEGSFTEPDLFLNTVRVSEGSSSYITKMLTYLKQNNRNHLAIINGGAKFDRDLGNKFEKLGKQVGVHVQLFTMSAPPPGVSGKDNIRNLYASVRSSGIRTIMRYYSKGPEHLLNTAKSAVNFGLVQEDYMWVFLENMFPIEDPVFDGIEEGSALDQLLSNSIVFAHTGISDGFKNHWANQNDEGLVSIVNETLPDGHVVQTNYFQTNEPRRGSDYVYDAVMAVGLGACRASIMSKNQTTPKGDQSNKPPQRGSDGSPSKGSPPTSNDGSSPPKKSPGKPPIPEITNDHVRGIADSVFQGATGPIRFEMVRGVRMRDRIGDDLQFGAYNIRGTTSVNGTRSYTPVLVSTSTKDGPWVNVPGEAVVYRDGTTNPPRPSRVIDENNYLPKWASAFGLTLMCLSMALATFCTIFVWRWRKERLVLAGQPEYLQTVNIGSILVSASIFCLSFDEGDGWSGQQLSVACTLTPWLFFLGMNTMWAGLFCKLWRIELLAQFRRVQIKVGQVLWPLIVLVSLTLICLIIWTVKDPWVWRRELINEYPVPETYGECTSDNFAAYFAPLSCLMIVSTALAAKTAWKTREAKIGHDQRYDDSNAVFLAIASQLQAWVVGLPILAVLRDQSSVEATYLGRVLLIWLFSLTTVAVVVLPKIATTYRWHVDPSSRPRDRCIRVSGFFDPNDMSPSRERAKSSQSGDRSSTGQPDSQHPSGSNMASSNSLDLGHQEKKEGDVNV